MRAKGLGADVIVTESTGQGYRSRDGRFPRNAHGRSGEGGDVYITVTGNKNVIRGEHFEKNERRGDRLQLRPLQRRNRYPCA